MDAKTPEKTVTPAESAASALPEAEPLDNEKPLSEETVSVIPVKDTPEKAAETAEIPEAAKTKDPEVPAEENAALPEVKKLAEPKAAAEIPGSLRDCAPEGSEDAPLEKETAPDNKEEHGDSGKAPEDKVKNSGEESQPSENVPPENTRPEVSSLNPAPEDAAHEIPAGPRALDGEGGRIPREPETPPAPPKPAVRERRVIDPLLFITYSGKPEPGDFSETPPAARNQNEVLEDSRKADTTWLHALPYSEGAVINTITNAQGNTVTIMDWGATVLDFSVWDPAKKLVYHPVLGTKPSRYAEQKIQLGATVGRVANRIAHGSFRLNGTDYNLVRDSFSEHTLHGGIAGFSEKRFTFTKITPASVTLKLVSPDMDNGFPGNLTLEVTYTLDDENALHIDYQAVTSRDTPINITSHIYWNLSLRNSLEGQFLKAEKAEILTSDESGIPDGGVTSQEDSPLDFSGILPLSYNIEAATECYPFDGIDHTLAFRDPRLPEGASVFDTQDPDSCPVYLMAELYCPETMMTLEVYSDYPALQVYSGNALEGVPGRTPNKVYRKHEGIALEPEYFPDAVNQPRLLTRCPVLRAGKTFKKSIVYKIVQNRIPEILEPLEVLEEEFAALEAKDRNAGEPYFRDCYAVTPDNPECRELPEPPASAKSAPKDPASKVSAESRKGAAGDEGKRLPRSAAPLKSGTAPDKEGHSEAAASVLKPEKLSALASGANDAKTAQILGSASGDSLPAETPKQKYAAENPFFRDTARESALSGSGAAETAAPGTEHR